MPTVENWSSVQWLRRISVRVPIGQVFCTIYVESLFTMFSGWPRLTGWAKEGGEEKERVSAPEYDSAVIVAPYVEKTHSLKRATTARALPNWRSGRGPSFLNYTIRASRMLRHLCHDLLLVWIQFSYRRCFVTCYCSVKKANRTWKETGF